MTYPADPYPAESNQPESNQPGMNPPDPYRPPTGEQPQQPDPYGQQQPSQYVQPYVQPQQYTQPQQYYGQQYPQQYQSQQYPAQQAYGYPAVPQPEQGMAIAALVCSLVGIFFCLPSILGIIFGHIGYSKAKRGEAGGQGMAQAGMIIGYVVCGLWLIPLLLWLFFGLAILGGAAAVN